LKFKFDFFIQSSVFILADGGRIFQTAGEIKSLLRLTKPARARIQTKRGCLAYRSIRVLKI
jgi:hypothetical protein